MIRFKYDILFGLIEWKIEAPLRKSNYFNTEHLKPKGKVVSMASINKVFKTQHKFNGRKPRPTPGDESLS